MIHLNIVPIKTYELIQFSSVQSSCSVTSDSLQPHESQHARPPCPSPTPGVYPNSCPSSRWCHPTISSSVIPFSSCPQSFPASGSFQMSQLFTSGGQNTGVSASTSVLPMNTQDWFPLGWTGWISLQSKGLSRVFSRGYVYMFSLQNERAFACGARHELSLWGVELEESLQKPLWGRGPSCLLPRKEQSGAIP